MEVKCEKCGSSKVIVEGISDGCVKVTCQECSDSSVQDKRGTRQLLGEEQTPPNMLTETMPLGG